MSEEEVQIALNTRKIDVQIDGTEEVIILESFCPNSECGKKIVSYFIVPRDKTKIQSCSLCGTKMEVRLPANSS